MGGPLLGHKLQKLIKKEGGILGTSASLGVKLNRQERSPSVNNTLVGFIVGIDKKGLCGEGVSEGGKGRIFC